MTQDIVYQAVIDRLQALEQEKAELEAFIAMHRDVSEKLGVSRVSESHDAVPPSSNPRPATTEEIMAKAMEVIDKVGHPVRLAALYELVVAEGIAIGGKKPRDNLGAKLSADPRLETLKGKGWWFKDEPIRVSALSDIEDFEPDEEAFPSYFEQAKNAEDPATFIAGPSQSNGAVGGRPTQHLGRLDRGFQ